MFLQPMLAIDVELEQKENFTYQVKWDGVRCVAHLNHGKVTLYSRNGGDLTASFPEVAEALTEVAKANEKLDLHLDGELVTFVKGRPSFDATLRRCAVTSSIKAELLSAQNHARFIVFDSFTDGTELAYRDRYAKVKDLLDDNPMLLPVSNCDNLDELKDLVKMAGVEGVVARNWSGKYYPGERCEILRWKQLSTVDTVIFGYEKGSGVKERSVGAFLLAAKDGFNWRYVGKVSSGISDAEMTELLAALVHTDREPSVDGYEVDPDHVFFKPDVVVEISHLGYENSGFLRNPSFVRRRKDKELSTM